MKYDVDLTYPKATRQPVYSIRVEAISKASAIIIASDRAAKEGMRGTPSKVVARMVDVKDEREAFA
ncbi:hypothetical protein [Metapseudomonas otitidis]|uniref:hypothetical protein n=1 Tax=Metapseudomonas otitidis TaxID=319939 RepID=UPI002447A415|nr:hypothetical protein [Pseudomonas otitidis]MDG9784670.1 hypothetical protein [Pseudomonas otitidis]